MSGLRAEMRPATRGELEGLPVEVAPRLLGGVLRTRRDGGEVAVRITEVEAYHGLGTGDVPDPGSHARMGYTARNATMWGPAGHLYVYLSHGIHSCVNVVCGPAHVGGGVLLRAGEVVEGVDVAARRRARAGGATSGRSRDLASGPGRLGQAIGLRHPIDDGIDAIAPACDGVDAAAVPRAGAQLWLRREPLDRVLIASGPRVGVAGLAGTDAFPWRYWIAGDQTVSPFRWGRGARDAASGV